MRVFFNYNSGQWNANREKGKIFLQVADGEVKKEKKKERPLELGHLPLMRLYMPCTSPPSSDCCYQLAIYVSLATKPLFASPQEKKGTYFYILQKNKDSNFTKGNHHLRRFFWKIAMKKERVQGVKRISPRSNMQVWTLENGDWNLAVCSWQTIWCLTNNLRRQRQGHRHRLCEISFPC